MVWVIARILFIRLSNILFSFFLSVLFRSQVSYPCVMIGIIYVSSIVHIVSIWIPLKLSSPAINRVVWRAASAFLSISCIWLLMFLLLLNVSPRYLYRSVWSIVISLSFSEMCSFLLPIFKISDFSFQNCMLYLLAVFPIMFRRLFWSGRLLVTSATSSIHRRPIDFLSIVVFSLSYFFQLPYLFHPLAGP